MSDYTKSLKKKKNVFFWLSTALWICTAIILTLILIIKGTEPKDGEILSKELYNKIMAMTVTVIIGLVVAVIIKEKIRNTFWMANIILGVMNYGSRGMWLVLFLWAIDEFIFHALYVNYKNKVVINKEIDKRE